jgi:predicted PurR-regulated permease PerM
MSREQWSTPARYLTLILIVVFLAGLSWYSRTIFQPLIIAGLLAYVMMPAVNWLKEKLKMKHKWAVNLVYFLLLALVLASPVFFVPELLSQLQIFSDDLLRLYEQALAFLNKPIYFGTFVIEIGDYFPELENSVANMLSAIPERALQILESTSRNTAWFFVIVVAVYYLLLDWDKIRDGIIRQAPVDYRRDARTIFLEIKEIWASYLRSQLALMGIVGVVFSIVWLAIGLPGALIIGILTGLLNIIPDLGPLVATVIALGVALLEGSLFLPISNFWFTVLVLVIYLVLVNLKNIWLRPRLMGRSVHLHEGLVFIAIIAAVLLQGILGAIIVVPVIASVLAIGRYLKAGIMGYEPVLREDLYAAWEAEQRKDAVEDEQETSP